MRIDVVGRNLEVTDAIRAYAEQKGNKLTRFYDGVQQVTFTLQRHDEKSGTHFDAELVTDVEKHDAFVCHAKHDDLYAAIDDCVHKGTRQLTDFKEKLKLQNR
ncbi:MAG: ribosome-associated translation inhibitor RaiA [Phycisphaerales bacterium]|nr:MAG: ribosome-associated translation inhibitor RaiA [Phycisphaerales bacterium]